MLDVACQCGVRFKLDDEWAGKQVKCPACGAVFAIGPRPPVAAMRPATPGRSTTKGFSALPAPKLAAVAGGALLFAVAGSLLASRLARPPAQEAGTSRASEQNARAADQGPPLDRHVANPAATPVKGNEGGEVSALPTAQPTGREEIGDFGATASSSSQPDPPTGAIAAAEPATEQAAPPAVTNGSGTEAGRSRTRRGKRSGELTGVSRTYDDLHCQLIQSRHGTRVPTAAIIIEVDGDRLPIANPSALAASRAPVLFLPCGTHAVRFRGNESLISVVIADHVLDEHWAMRDFFGVGGTVREDELLSRSARALDSHGAPMLLNLMGAALAKKGDWAAAERKFRRSLLVNPCFSPAHLNMAWCLEHRGAKSEATRELRLAAMFNVGNVFGLAAATHELAARVGVAIDGGEPIVFDPTWYLPPEASSLGDDDRRITALLVSLSKYAQLDTERAKILNNLGVHFAESGRAELALDHFRSALAVLKQTGPERFALARQVLTHMSDACRRAGLPEADEYERMQSLVSP
ncbi:MAG TPA: hypothetical protein VG826_23310 [Pirellulales bacterium]|nr:hypothetical protein [Pirellulales bacterium]